MPEIGDLAPDFSLDGIDKDGQEGRFRLSGLLQEGKKLILYFYPRDNTPGCTAEACDFRDNLNRLTVKALVAGVSPDSVESHRKFGQKHSLNFTLLCDPGHEAMALYGAWGEKKMYGKTATGVIRSTYIIGPDGRIVKKWLNVKAKGHVDKVLAEI